MNKVTLEELLEKDRLASKDIEAYFKKTGLKKIKKADLDLIIEKYGTGILHVANFSLVYNLKLEESNKRLFFWITLMAILIGCIGVWRWLS